MNKLLLVTIASLGLSACASGPSAEPSPPEVIVQWGADNSFLEAQSVYFVEGTEAPGVVLNVATPWTHGHSSLLSPAATCPATIIRVRADGDVERAYELPMGQRPVPTLNARCFPNRPSER